MRLSHAPRIGCPWREPLRERAKGCIGQITKHADDRDECHYLRRHQELAIPLDCVTEATWCADELGGDHGRP